MITNREHATRITYSIPLRESFAIPIIYLQIFFSLIYIKLSNRSTHSWIKKIITIFVFISTLFYCLFWQFGSFILLIQSFTIYLNYFINILHFNTTKYLLTSNLIALLATYALQFGNMFVIVSFGLNFVWITLIYIYVEQVMKIVFKKIWRKFI